MGLVVSEYLKTWQKTNRAHINVYHQQYRRQLKLEVLGHYSDGEVCCACCGEGMLDFLNLDHIDGLGSEHRLKTFGRASAAGYVLYVHLRARNFPPGFQVLCYNCNLACRFGKQCPHQLELVQRDPLPIKRRVLEHYADGVLECKCCKEQNIVFLTLDHINGGGSQQSKIVGKGYNFYFWLEKNHFPSGLQILCYNCNCGKGRDRTCPHESSPPTVAVTITATS